MKKTPELAMIAALVFWGCNAVETINPLPGSNTTSGTTSGSGGHGGEGAGAGGQTPETPIRTVETRNPFGNVAATDNLLWDGDFEWTSPFSDQYGWLYGPPYTYQFPAPTIGAACRSGIKCITIPKKKGMIGIGVGTKSDMLSVTVFGKPKNPVCADIEVSLMSLDNSANDIPIAADSETPDSLGWCLYRGMVSSYPSKVYLLVHNNSLEEAIIDDAVVRAVPPGDGEKPAPPPAMAPPSAETMERHEQARQAIKERQGPHDPPPNAAKRAFEEWKKR